MIALLVIGIIAVVIGLYLMETNKGSKGDPNSRLGGRVASIIGALMIVISIITGSFATIPAGHRGVVIRFSTVTGTILEEGFCDKKADRTVSVIPRRQCPGLCAGS